MTCRRSRVERHIGSRTARPTTTGGLGAVAALGVGPRVVLAQGAPVHDLVVDGDDTLTGSARGGDQHRLGLLAGFDRHLITARRALPRCPVNSSHTLLLARRGPASRARTSAPKR